MNSGEALNKQKLLEITHDWILRLEEPDVNDETRTEFSEWLTASPIHRDLYDQAITLSEAFHKLSNDDFSETNLAPTVPEHLTALTDMIISYWSDTRVRIAAGVAVVATALAVVPPMQLMGTKSLNHILEEPVMASFETNIGESDSFTLADGTEITLGAASKARSVYTNDKRIVEVISGSVFVDVERDEARPFSVLSGNLTATALGTSFDVRQAGNIHRVSVAEGEVQVSFPFVFNGQVSTMISRKKLGTGQAVSATDVDGLQKVTSVNPHDVGVWRQDELIYEGATLEEVFADANRYSSLPIVIEEGLEKISDLQLRGVFHGSDIHQLLSTVARIHDLEIDRTETDRILVRRKILTKQPI